MPVAAVTPRESLLSKSTPHPFGASGAGGEVVLDTDAVGITTRADGWLRWSSAVERAAVSMGTTSGELIGDEQSHLVVAHPIHLLPTRIKQFDLMRQIEIPRGEYEGGWPVNG